MSFGFGFGLPHKTFLKVGGSTPTYAYFMSLFPSTGNDITPSNLFVDTSSNIVTFGSFSIDSDSSIKLTSVGNLSVAKKLSGGSLVPIYVCKDTTNNYYAFTTFNLTGVVFPQIYKYDSSLNVTTSETINLSGYSSTGASVVDSSGNIWSVFIDGTTTFLDHVLVQVSNTLTPIAYYSYYTSGASYASIAAITATNLGNLIIAGYNGTVGSYYMQSVPTTNVYTSNWTITSDQVMKLITDTTSNIYFISGSYFAKFNSSGASQWARDLTSVGYNAYLDIAVDSSGNVYVLVDYTSTSAIILKLNSAGTLQYARTLSYAAGTLNASNITIDGTAMYVSGYLNTGVPFVFKVPTDGTHTQSFTVGGYALTYANLTATVSPAAATNTPTTAITPVTTYSPTTGAGLLSSSNISPTPTVSRANL